MQARQPFANIVKLLCSFLCPLSLGAFALLLRSLERVIGISFYLFAISPEVGDNREILAYFCFMLQALSFQPVAVWQTYLRSAVVC